MRRVLLLAGLLFASGAFAQRAPVLKQIDLPHNYYFREMYLPQLTSGPSALAFGARWEDAGLLHAGILWKQDIDSNRRSS